MAFCKVHVFPKGIQNAPIPRHDPDCTSCTCLYFKGSFSRDGSVKSITDQELTVRADHGQLTGALLSGSTLAGWLDTAEMSHLRVENSEFRDLWLYDANMKLASLDTVRITSCTAKRCHLTNANIQNTVVSASHFNAALFDHAVLESCEFQKVDLSHADFSSASLEQCNFSDVVFYEARFVGATARSCRFQLSGNQSHFTNARFTECHLEDANFKSQELMSARFELCSIVDARFQNAQLGYCSFDGSDLRGAKFINAKVAHCSFVGADLRNANFFAADISGSDFRMADLSGARFDRTRYDEHTAWPEGFMVPDTAFSHREKKDAVEAFKQAYGCGHEGPGYSLSGQPCYVRRWVEKGFPVTFVVCGNKRAVSYSVYSVYPELYIVHNGRWAAPSGELAACVEQVVKELMGSLRTGDGEMPFKETPEKLACVTKYLRESATSDVLRAYCDANGDTAVGEWLTARIKSSLASARRKSARARESKAFPRTEPTGDAQETAHEVATRPLDTDQELDSAAK